MPLRGVGQIGEHHMIRRYIEQLIRLCIIEVMVVIYVGIKEAMLVMQCHTPQQSGVRKLVEGIINRAISNMDPNSPDFRV